MAARASEPLGSTVRMAARASGAFTAERASARGERTRRSPSQRARPNFYQDGALRVLRVATPSLMMEVSPSGLAARSQVVSNLAVAQLLVCFLAGLLRPDSFVVGRATRGALRRARTGQARADAVRHPGGRGHPDGLRVPRRRRRRQLAGRRLCHRTTWAQARGAAPASAPARRHHSARTHTACALHA